MPYITKKRRQEIKQGSLPSDLGEANYFITTEYIIPKWEHDKSYYCIAKMEESLFSSEYGKDWNLEAIKGMLEKIFSRSQVNSACRLAFLEFYRVIGSKYEAAKAKANGNLYKGVL